MKKIFLNAAILASFAAVNQAKAQSFNDLLNQANQVLNSATKGSSSSSTGTTNSGGGLNLNNLSNTDVVGALRQALQIGAQNASGRLSAVNGFFGNSLIKVLMPPEAQKVENTLRQIGMGSIVDKAILSMNRAAEDAAGKAVPIFVNAISTMSIQDGMTILQGGNGAATKYLKDKTTASLTSAFQPVISSSLGKTGATAYWSNVFNVYNKLPTTMNKINPDLTSYVTERALNGLFVNIADEENKIRTNPAARVTDLLQKVFGAH
ncbi:DUF4197 domain-containing protein [Taibaiella soli]|uniref:DUF4197 domain-containing protein n=1 Tax=Taibaiella soli TaxID=1649169 RepID=A0A2W2BYE6_9BACT|nr:DUF4197 domain-containing protein [Taibaiella soli]PZF72893.1 DUF4197 domain-containing protein [Taibaiella soli]